jgi:hypothetical protein
MSERLLNLRNAPEDPIERLVWLGGVKEAVEKEMEDEWSEAYFWSRFTGRLDDALALKLHSRKRVMAFSRHWNERVGRQVRWGDGRS